MKPHLLNLQQHRIPYRWHFPFAVRISYIDSSYSCKSAEDLQETLLHLNLITGKVVPERSRRIATPCSSKRGPYVSPTPEPEPEDSMYWLVWPWPCLLATLVLTFTLVYANASPPPKSTTRILPPNPLPLHIAPLLCLYYRLLCLKLFYKDHALQAPYSSQFPTHSNKLLLAKTSTRRLEFTILLVLMVDLVEPGPPHHLLLVGETRTQCSNHFASANYYC